MTVSTPDMRQWKTLLTNSDQKSIETMFSFAICCQSGNKWQLKTLCLMIFYQISLIVLTFLIAAFTFVALERHG